MEETKSKATNGTKIFWVIVVLALLVGGYMFFSMKPKVSSLPAGESATPSQVTIYGEYVCLPHKDADGPVTMECAFGLLADSSGLYYGLDLTDVSQNVRDILQTGSKITVEGIFTPIAENSVQKYNIVGTIRVSNVMFGDFDSKG
jgi:hypothetical protein